jgi:hypothetical protein
VSFYLHFLKFSHSYLAPTFFSAVDGKYIDGGIISNNPALELMHEIQTWNSFNKFKVINKYKLGLLMNFSQMIYAIKNLSNSIRIGCLLSIGTGAIPPTRLEVKIYKY